MRRLPIGAAATAALLAVLPALAAGFALLTGAGMGHGVAACAEALRHGAALPAVAMALLTASILIPAAGSVIRGVRAGRRALRLARAHAVGPSPGLAAAARRLGIRRLVVTDIAGVAFCVGAVRPVVVVAADLERDLGPGPLAGILAHEASHARMRDPLRHMLDEAIARGLWFVPIVRRAAGRRRLAIELRADAAALAVAGRRALLEALLTVSEPPAGRAIASARALLGARIDALDPDAGRPDREPAPWATRVASAAGLAAALAIGLLGLAPGLALAIGLTCCPGLS